MSSCCPYGCCVAPLEGDGEIGKGGGVDLAGGEVVMVFSICCSEVMVFSICCSEELACVVSCAAEGFEDEWCELDVAVLWRF